MRPHSFVRDANPPKSVFDLSYSKMLTADMGPLYPVMCDEVIPGDLFTIGNEVVVRMLPLVCPCLTPIHITTHYFFVPYRILWDNGTDDSWEEFITDDDESCDPIPTWDATSYGVGSLWDFLGFPMTKPNNLPLAFPQYAYNLIWNEYYRDSLKQTEVVIESNEELLYRCWEKDYFTSAQADQQLGTPVLTTLKMYDSGDVIPAEAQAVWPAVVANNQATMYFNSSSTVPYSAGTKAALENNTIDLEDMGFTISDMRESIAIQQFMERDMRTGNRYTEFLRSHFGVAPRDERLDRPEYIGGTKTPIIVSEVLQTESSDASTPQGNMAGHGISVGQGYAGKYRVTEFGLIMGLMSITCEALYEQGLNRQWNRVSRYDFAFPEFVNLSEQGILQQEIFSEGNAGDDSIIGYIGRFDEMRVKHNMVCGEFRKDEDFDYWHLSRQFSGAPDIVVDSFLKHNPRKDIFASPSDPGFLVSFGNRIKAVRPLPVINEPGLGKI